MCRRRVRDVVVDARRGLLFVAFAPSTAIMNVPALDRITFNPNVMGGRPCIRGMRVTVGTLVGLVASGHTTTEILDAYPYIEEPDIRQALAYAAWRADEIDIPLTLP
jgi:uncharacterized protein (DUF433 family)